MFRVALVVLVCLLVAAPARAATIAVTSGGDTSAADGACTLREAIDAANDDVAVGGCVAGDGSDTITIGPKTVALGSGSNDDMNLAGDLDVVSTVAVRGAAGGTTVLGNGDRVFDVRPGGQLTLTGLTVTGGLAPQGQDGGGIRNEGGLSLERVTVTGNATSVGRRGSDVSSPTTNPVYGAFGQAGGSGGGIASTGVLTVTRSTISDNASGGGGTGGNGTATYLGHTGTGGPGGAGGDGGGIYSEGPATIRDSTVSGNRTGPGGPGGDGQGAAGNAATGSGDGGNGGEGDGGRGERGGAGGGWPKEWAG